MLPHAVEEGPDIIYRGRVNKASLVIPEANPEVVYRQNRTRRSARALLQIALSTHTSRPGNQASLQGRQWVPRIHIYTLVISMRAALYSSTDRTYSWCSSSSLSLSCPCSVGTALILSRAVEFPLAMSSDWRLAALRWRRLSWVTAIVQGFVSLVERDG